MNNYLIIGISGFIGQHLAGYLGSNTKCLIVKTKNNQSKFCDVRERIHFSTENSSVIYNLVGIHIPLGYEYHEYFETNIKGAENTWFVT